MLAGLFAILLSTSPDQDADVTARMQAWARSLGVECTHCHVEGDLTHADKPAFEMAQRMSTMVAGLNDGRLKVLGGITCWTCHRGATRPARLPRVAWEEVAAREAAVFVGPREKLSLAMSVYSSSLGVDCDHCHDRASWESAAKPAHATARQMMAMFEELPVYFTKERRPSFQCYTCHQGAIKPQR